MKIGLLTLFLCAMVLLSACDRSPKQYQGYVEGENIYLASPNSGILKQLFVHRGDQVKKGQILFQLDEDPQILVVKQYEADLVQAQKTLNDLEQPRRTPEIEAIKAQIEQTEARLKLAEIRVRRMQTLYAKQAIDKDSVDAAIARYKELQQLKIQYESNLQLARLGSRNEQVKAQQAQVISLTARLKEAQWQLNQKRMYAPAAGYIFDTYFQVGEFVANEQAVLSLLPPQYVRIQFFVPVDILPRLKRGQRIQFLCFGCSSRGTAVINYISPEAEYVPPLVFSRENNDKLVFRIKARIDQPEKFKPGQPVTVLIP
ncbi:HlyD family secretion protein [Legionella hackeliae]|uniref:Periplasmic component of efflux system n=1 Tax=Legionella hackeliae TaxID=449 RepID=A0A0A8UR77_LEGHA|nr:HlyD family efflux transporter periplasmic adaptor subunit [Legionella hackeliae]KTD10084.1 hemolysin D [Legionella hackeliae]CEK09572.1 Periplasmic component of efflux system [Legionella hackeliae]STX49482.1 hemolysin D [Legionella hackeliae]